jgi:thiamine pyrophosphokinase
VGWPVNVFIFLNGRKSSARYYSEHFDAYRHEQDRVVCANGGYRLAQLCGVKPDLIVGDLDSLKEETIEEGIEVRRHPRNKDFSDFELALQAASGMTPQWVYVYGALGGRIDHELTNILLINSVQHPTVFIEEETEIYGVHEGLVINDRKGCICSLLSLWGACRVKEIRGFQYALKNEVLYPSSRGLSNVITEDEATITLANGNLIAVVNTVER